MNPEQDEAEPWPGLFPSTLLTLAASFAALLLNVALLRSGMENMAARALALSLALGAAGAWAASSVPAPHEERLGLRRPRLLALLWLIFLVPVVFLASEADNLIRSLLPAAEEASFTFPSETSFWLILLLLRVGIEPPLYEWFFRGVLLQGIGEQLGRVTAVIASALLFAVFEVASRGALTLNETPMFCSALLLGAALGYTRVATRSLLAAIALHAGANLVGIGGLIFADRVAIAGFNAPGDHSPLWILVAAGGSCAVAVFGLEQYRNAPERTPAPDDV